MIQIQNQSGCGSWVGNIGFQVAAIIFLRTPIMLGFLIDAFHLKMHRISDHDSFLTTIEIKERCCRQVISQVRPLQRLAADLHHVA